MSALLPLSFVILGMVDSSQNVFERIRARRPDCSRTVDRALYIRHLPDPGKGESPAAHHKRLRESLSISLRATQKLIQSLITRRLFEAVLDRLDGSDGGKAALSGTSPEELQKRVTELSEGVLELDEALSASRSEDPFSYGLVSDELYQEFLREVSAEGRHRWLQRARELFSGTPTNEAQKLQAWMTQSAIPPLPPEAHQIKRLIHSSENKPATILEMIHPFFMDAIHRASLSNRRDRGVPQTPLDTLILTFQTKNPDDPLTALFEKHSMAYALAPLRSPLGRQFIKEITGVEVTDDALDEEEAKQGSLVPRIRQEAHPFSEAKLGGTSMIIRALLDFAVESPFVFRPTKKRDQFGDYLFVNPNFQLAVWIHPTGSLKALRFLNENEFSLNSVLPNPNAPMPSPPLSPFYQKESSLPAHAFTPVPIRPMIPIDFARELADLTPKYRELWTKDLEHMNQQFPGTHEFLTEAARTISLYSNLTEGQDRSWLSAVIRQIARRLTEGHGDTESSILELLTRIEGLEIRRSRISKTLRLFQFRASSEEEGSRSLSTLEDYFTEEGLRALPTNVVLDFQLQGNLKGSARVIISPEAKEFIQSQPNPLRWFRALKKGTVGGTSRNGIEKIKGEGFAYSHELKLVQSGAHLRLGMNQNAEGIWLLEGPFEKLR